jgi:hypothetical protein
MEDGSVIYRWTGGPDLNVFLRDGFDVGTPARQIVDSDECIVPLPSAFGFSGPNEIVTQACLANSGPNGAAASVIRWSPMSSEVLVEGASPGVVSSGIDLGRPVDGLDASTTGDTVFGGRTSEGTVVQGVYRVREDFPGAIDVLIDSSIANVCSGLAYGDQDPLWTQSVSSNDSGSVAIREARTIMEYTPSNQLACRHLDETGLLGYSSVDSRTFDPVINNDREIAISAKVDNGPSLLVILAPDPVDTRLVAKSLDPVPPLPGATFVSFGSEPDINNRGDVVFMTEVATALTEHLLLYRADTDSFVLLASEGDPVPDRAPRTFRSFSEPDMNDNRQVMFKAELDDGSIGVFFTDEAAIVTCLVEDVNCDGTVDVGDIGAVGNPLNFQMTPPACDRADVNGDGTADVGDIGAIGHPFVFQTSTGPCECETATPGAPGCPQ